MRDIIKESLAMLLAAILFMLLFVMTATLMNAQEYCGIDPVYCAVNENERQRIERAKQQQWESQQRWNQWEQRKLQEESLNEQRRNNCYAQGKNAGPYGTCY